MPHANRPFRALTIAGSDSGGGAGIQADLKTFQALGCFGMSAVTVLTAQNTCGVRSVFPASPAFVVEQIQCVVEDIGVDAIKIGMLFSVPLIEAVADYLKPLRFEKIVVDPVMVAKGGSRLLEPDAITALKERILPLAGIVTPNLPEAEVLTGMTIRSRDEMQTAARALLEVSPRVVIKGGHLSEIPTSPDFFVSRSEPSRWIERPRVTTANTHGTGCTFSAAIAAYLARGQGWFESTEQAKEFLHQAIVQSADWKVGKGCGPLNHAWQWSSK